MGRFRSMLVAFQLSVINTILYNMLAWTNTLAYYRISKLRIRSVFIVQAPELTRKYLTTLEKAWMGPTVTVIKKKKGFITSMFESKIVCDLIYLRANIFKILTTSKSCYNDHKMYF